MKFTPEVIAALETLRKNAENDFELHRISVLEKDLTAPPVVEIIDNNHQKFNGIIYYADKQQHFHKDIQLHRAVYAYYNGEITIEGLDVHHVNVNPADNNIGNLQLLTRSEHRKTHGTHQAKNNPERACPICGKTLADKESTAKYCSRECWKKSRRTFHAKEKHCLICDTKFFTTSDNPNQKYCSRECANKAKTFHNRNKICPVCQKPFVAPSIKPYQIYCSRACSAKWHTFPKIEKICPICGKNFYDTSGKKQKNCCSKSCAVKYRWQKIKTAALHKNNNPLES